MSGGRKGIVFPSARTVTIASGAATSDAEDIRGKAVVGLITPAEYDGTAISFTVSMDNTTFVALTDADTGASIAIVAAASKAYVIDPILTLAWNYLKVVAGTNQSTTDTVVTLCVRALA